MMYNTNPYVAQGYGMVQQKPKNTNPVTKEQLAELRQKGGGLSLVPTKEEITQAICTHRDLVTGESRLRSNNDGTVTCEMCGATFSTMEIDQEQAKDAANVVIDILENIKALYLDIPEQVCAEYMRIIPLVKKIPDLYKVASDNFKMYEGVNPMSYEGNNNIFARYNMMTGPVAPQYSYAQPTQYQPYYQPQQMMPYAAPMNEYVQQPYYQPQQLQMTAEAPVGNPFYGQPVQQQAQPVPQPQFTNINNAATATPPAQPTAPATENVEVTKQFNV